MKPPALPRLMLVTDRHRTRHRDLVLLVEAAVRGGVGLVHVREKDLADDALRDLVQRLRAAVSPGTRFVVNGSARVARTLRTGLHRAAAEPVGAVPPLRGELFGRSVHDGAEARSALADPVDYLLLGTIFPSESKPGAPGGGVDLVREICTLVAPVPVYAIGGITVSVVPEVLHAGAHGVAVCGAILGAPDPARVAQALTLAIEVSAPSA